MGDDRTSQQLPFKTDARIQSKVQVVNFEGSGKPLKVLESGFAHSDIQCGVNGREVRREA